MKIYNVLDLALKHNGEYVLGSADLHTHACYFIYGVLNPGEKGRPIKPGKGHEEIIFLVQGEVFIRGDTGTFSLKQGQAFYLKGEETYLMDNNGKGDAVYVISGGHSEGHLH
jgi:glyoxylate utilization-related uncharacterized protein